MATLWITYAWEDNKAGDIDFIAQELIAAGLKIKLDRWNLSAGKPLWDQIAEFIQNPTECDAWLLIATQASLGSEACREEFRYALDRALASRTASFPVIGLFPATVEKSLIPAGIRTRLYVSLRDPDWKERIVAAAERRDLNLRQLETPPYHMQVHGDSKMIEVRPRAGTWSPFIAAVPLAEKDLIKMDLLYGPSGKPPLLSPLFGVTVGTNHELGLAFIQAQNEATPTMSYFIKYDEPPSKLLFGCNAKEVYTVDRNQT